jgi:hypothetical protein
LLSEEPIPFGQGKEVLKRIIECKLIMDPVQAKEFLKFLNFQIERYERLMGKIPTGEDIERNLKKIKTLK